MRFGSKACLLACLLSATEAMVRAQAAATLKVDRNSVTARGTWMPVSGVESRPLGIANPVVEIHCSKSEQKCMQATAIVRDGAPGLAVLYYRIVLWDPNGIVAQNDDFTCTTNRLILNLRDSVVMALDVPKKNGKALAEACKSLPAAISYKLAGE